MRKLWVVLIIVLTLSACNETNTHSDSGSVEASNSVRQGYDAQYYAEHKSEIQSSDTETSDTQSFNTEHSYNNIPDEYIPDQSKNTGYFSPLNNSALYRIDSYLQELETANFIAQEDIAFLKSVGIDVNISDVEKIDNDSFSFSLNMKNNAGNAVSLEITAILSYHNNGTEDDAIPTNLSFYWGTITYTDNRLIITVTDKIYVYDNPAQNLTATEIKPEFAADSKPYYLVFAMPEGSNYMAMMYNKSQQTSCVKFNSSGTVLSNQPPNDPTDYDYFYDYNAATPAFKFNCRTHTIPLEVSNGKYYSQVFFNNNESAFGRIFDFNNNTTYETAVRLNYITNDGLRVVLFNPNYNKNFIANVYKNNNIIAQHVFETDLLHFDFPYSPDGTNDAQPIINFENNLLTLSNPVTTCTLEVDFDNKSENITFDFTAEDLQDDYLTRHSPSGRYSLHSVFSYGGGDISYDYMAVLDTNTDEVSFIDITGGMYGGGSTIGFLPNDDIYSTNYTKYKIFSAENGFAETLSLKDSLNLGADSADENSRIIFSVWRNPENLELVAVYSDIFLDEFRQPRGSDKTHLTATYKIALLSESGELIDSYDTGQNVRYPGMAYDTVTIEPSGDNLTLYTSWKTDINLLGTFNLNTKTYTAGS